MNLTAKQIAGMSLEEYKRHREPEFFPPVYVAGERSAPLRKKCRFCRASSTTDSRGRCDYCGAPDA